MKFFLKVSYALFLSSILSISQANASSPIPPRLSASAYASDFTVGQADVMLPLSGDPQHNLYVDPSLGFGSDEQGYADVGLGYRWIQNQAAIYGAYLFGGYSRIANNARLWVINPGVEVLGSRWDAHLNGYIVAGDQHTTVDRFSQFALFTGHTELHDFFSSIQYAGSGLDVGAGYQLFSQSSLKTFIGGYFFSPAHGNVGGGLIGFEYWPDTFLKVFTAYSYDNINHSTGMLGLGIELGGTHYHRINPTLEERITDPVQRYLAELGHGSKIPSRIVNQFTEQASVSDSAAFFSQTGTPNNGGVGLNAANCTFESPCGPTDLTDISATTLSMLLPNTSMYFNGGSYNAVNVPGGTNPVTLQPGQSIQSRTANYSQAATGAGRSTFNGAFVMPQNNQLNNVILLSTTDTATGAGATFNAGNNVVVGSQIGSGSNPFVTAILSNGGSLMVNSSQLTAAGTSGAESPAGILMNNASSLLLNNSSITVNNDTGAGAGLTSGVNINSTGNAILQNNTFAVNGNNAKGVLVQASSLVTLNNLTIALMGSSGSLEGVLAAANSPTINASNLNVTLTNGGAGIATGFNTTATSTATITGSQFTITNTAVGGFLRAIEADGNSQLNISNSRFSVIGMGTGGSNSISGLVARDSGLLKANNVTGTVSATTGAGINYGIIFDSTANNLIQNSRITVNGITARAVLAESNGVGTVANSILTVTGTVGSALGIVTQSGGSVTAIGTTLNVNETGVGPTIGLNTIGATDIINFSNGTLSVSGANASIKLQSSTGPVVITASTCVLNGTTVTC